MRSIALALGLALAPAASTLAASPAARPTGAGGAAQAKAAKAAEARPAAGAAGAAGAGDAAGADDDNDRGGASARKRTREGSVLKSDTLLPGHVDLRSEAERRRDTELEKHFGRMARLDVIAAIAAQAGDDGLGEDVEQVRRKEVQRHQKVMMALGRAMAQAAGLATGGQP